MARPNAKAPACRYHMSGKSVVTIGGKDLYLGKHDSPESIARYAVLIGVYQKNGLTLPEGFDISDLDQLAGMLLGTISPTAVTQQSDLPVLVSHVTALFRDHVDVRYKNAPIDQKRFKRLCGQLDAKFGDVPADQFGPLKLKLFRDDLVKAKLARKHVNRLTNCIVAIFRHAVACEMIDVGKVHQLETLEPLRNGQTDAHETEEVKPANLAHVRATAKYLSPIIKSMMRIQIATGMRPKEIFSMRPCDIDRTGEVWLYTPSGRSKGEAKGSGAILFGTRLVLRRF